MRNLIIRRKNQVINIRSKTKTIFSTNFKSKNIPIKSQNTCQLINYNTILNSSVKKTDKKDAKMLARNLAFGTCSFVHIPDDIDQETRELIRMRNSHKKSFKKKHFKLR